MYTRDFVFDIKAMSTQANFNLPVMQSKYKYMHKYHYHFQNICINMYMYSKTNLQDYDVLVQLI